MKQFYTNMNKDRQDIQAILKQRGQSDHEWGRCGGRGEAKNALLK